MTGNEVSNWKLKARIIERFGQMGRFANALGVSRQAVTDGVHGWKKITPDQQATWAALLGCKPEELFAEK